MLRLSGHGEFINAIHVQEKMRKVRESERKKRKSYKIVHKKRNVECYKKLHKKRIMQHDNAREGNHQKCKEMHTKKEAEKTRSAEQKRGLMTRHTRGKYKLSWLKSHNNFN